MIGDAVPAGVPQWRLAEDPIPERAHNLARQRYAVNMVLGLFFENFLRFDQFGIVAYTLQMPTIRRTDEFLSWLKNLRDVTARAKILQRIDRLAPGKSRRCGPGRPGRQRTAHSSRRGLSRLFYS